MNDGQQDGFAAQAFPLHLTNTRNKQPSQKHSCPTLKCLYRNPLAFVGGGGGIHRPSCARRLLTATLMGALWATSHPADGQPTESDYNSQPSDVPMAFSEGVQAPSEFAQDLSTSDTPNNDFQPSPTVSSAALPEIDQQSGGELFQMPVSLIEVASLQRDSEGPTAPADPGNARGLDAIVPFLLPLHPYAPIFASPDGSIGMSATSEDIGRFSAATDTAATAPPPRFAFYGPQSDDLRVDDCQRFDAFLVSPLPSSVASKFSDFVQKEASQTDGMPYLHHMHGRPAEDPADGEENPRLVVEGGKVTHLWSEFTEDNPIFRMDEGTVTLIRLVAPVKSAYDAMASMMLMPIIDVNLAYGDGLLLSYKVSGEEGRQADHQHQDETHRPVAELHIAYKSCFAVEGDSNDPISVRAELRLSGCEPVVLMWKVVCSAGALLQEAPSGFNIAIGPLTPPPTKSSASVLRRSAADLPWDPSLAPSPTVADLRAVTAKEGDLVANGVVGDRVAAVQPTTLVFDPSQDFVEMYAWCRGCKDGRLEMQIPTTSADLQVMYPLLYNYVGDSRREGTATEQPVSLVASKPSSHVILKEMLPGLEENVHRFILQFQCKSEGESIVGIDFSFHGYRDVQIFVKKQCVAPASASLRDPSCSSGVLSDDGAVCCLASCGACGGDGCEDREGGLTGCCVQNIVSSALPCSVITAPCVIGYQQNRATKELRMALALPEEASAQTQRFNLLLAPLWFICVCLAFLKLLLWCLSVLALVVYVFTVGYGVYILEEPFPVAAAPSAYQLFNTILLIVGHVRHLYKTHGSSLFAGEGFHSYTPFEDGGGKPPGRKLSSAENPFRPPVRWRASEDHNSCIRLTSLKAKAAGETNPDHLPPESIRPLEFCDIEADTSNLRARSSSIDDTLWEGPQGDFQADTWADDTTAILNSQNEEEYSNLQGSQHYREFSGSAYDPF